MKLLERYDAALKARAEEHHSLAVQARERGDEREHSLQLMQESMCGDMLRVLGHTQHQRPEGQALQRVLEGARGEEERFRSRDDADGADRARIKAETIAWALDTLKEMEKENGEASDAV